MPKKIPDSIVPPEEPEFGERVITSGKTRMTSVTDSLLAEIEKAKAAKAKREAERKG